MSDPEKRKKYDKYGTLDEDDWDYQEFMKNFNFENIFNFFDEDFLEGALNDQLLNSTMKHGVKLMLIRKEAEGDLEQDEESYIDQNSIKYKDGLPYNIYGHGSGLENTKNLMFWAKNVPAEDFNSKEWEEIESKQVNEKKGGGASGLK